MRTLALLLCLLTTTLWAQQAEAQPTLYRLGLSYQMSTDPSWGQGRPVVTSSIPYSPAYRADLRVGDIIEQIDGIPTRGMRPEDIQSLLERPVNTHLLTINSLGRGVRQVALTPEPKYQGAVTERELARAFSLYSLEDEQVRRLSYPFAYRSSGSYDLSSVRTFSFVPSTGESRSLDADLYAQVSELLERQGLRRDDTSPDLLFECFYELRPETGASRDASIPKVTSHYTPREKGFVRLPVLPFMSGAVGSYSVHLALQAVRPQLEGSILWSCEARDMLSEAMTLKDYARYMLPMMLEGFPFVSVSDRPSFLVHISRYYYTGLLYDASSLDLVADVEDHSPAFQAGLRRGDRILQINGHRLSPTSPQALSSLYRTFVADTYRYRDTKQDTFTDARGVMGLSPWNKSDYGTIRKSLEKEKYATAFAYLFAFRPYINNTDHTELTLEIMRGGETYTIRLTPELRDESTVSLDNIR